MRQFAINNRVDHSNQLTTTIEMIQKFPNGEIDEINEKVVILREDGKGLREKVREAERE